MEMKDLLKNALTEINPLILSNDAPPILNPLFKEASKHNIGVKQSDIFKVIIIFLLTNNAHKGIGHLLIVSY